ncbi:alpha/beta fold hydrolase [Paracoccus sp. TK19116]|uniref:Alpha/beta fold hydrolase n=1 Tax=Paracoccus albicereus TaxID=2922394 RepID=A0ABT1MSL5_9RHOB|nr:alpha/beta hydrolase [Paracoccus albicereus]MCQ0970521.1 alpha/beta fold hydrolase [Paracoccus albicereus]
MALVHVNADDGAAPAEAARVAGTLDADAPIIVMIHGYRFSPASPSHDPHRHILAMQPDGRARRVLSWPRALGIEPATSQDLAVGFGWEARGSLRRAYASAEDSASALARIVDRLAETANRPVALIAHSLGARVALGCLHHVSAGSLGRTILLAGAEFRTTAEQALSTPAGRRAEIINVTSRENDLFDFALEMLLSAGRRQALGFGLSQPRRNWVDVQIDDARTLAELAQLGFPMDPHALRMCHWSPYLRRGVFDFYRTALRQPWALPLGMLRLRLPQPTAPRWSRLFATTQDAGGLRA